VFFLLIDLLLFLKFISFSSRICFKWFKVFREHQLKLYKSSLSVESNGATCKDCLVVWLLASKCFEKKTFRLFDPRSSRDHIFLNFQSIFDDFWCFGCDKIRGSIPFIDHKQKFHPLRFSLIWPTNSTYKQENKRKNAPSLIFKIK